MGGVLKTSYQSVSDTGNIQKTRKESGAPPTTEVTGLRAWLRMKEYGYALSGFLQRDICGRKAAGFRYTYEAGDSGMSGETFAMKYGRRMYYLNVYYRTVIADESRKIWKDILDSVSDLK